MSSFVPDRMALRRFVAFLGAATVILAVFLASSAVVTKPVRAQAETVVHHDTLPLAATSAGSLTNVLVAARVQF